MLVTRHHDVDHCEEHKDECLHHAYQAPERVKDDRHDELGQAGKNPEHVVIGEHVGKKTDTERERTRQVIDDFDQQHKDHEREPGEFPHWAEKAFEVAGALMPETLVQVEEEADYRQSPSDVGVGGCRLPFRGPPPENPQHNKHKKTPPKPNILTIHSPPLPTP